MDIVITAVVRVPDDQEARDVMDWLEREAPRAGITIVDGFAVPLVLPRQTDASSTELGDPEE